jgi:hypothetical protein
MLDDVMPPLVAIGSQLVFMPFLHRDLGRWSPWGRFLGLRREFDVIVGALIDRVAADPNLEQRDDVLSLMLQSRYEDGTAMSRSDLAGDVASRAVAQPRRRFRAEWRWPRSGLPADPHRSTRCRGRPGGCRVAAGERGPKPLRGLRVLPRYFTYS